MRKKEKEEEKEESRRRRRAVYVSVHREIEGTPEPKRLALRGLNHQVERDTDLEACAGS